MLGIWFDGVGGGRAFYQDVWQIAPALRPLKQDVVGSVGNVLWVVLGTVGVVLLIACANVTNLLLVRAEGRERELAVRAALGAGSWRIARVLLLETVTLALLGGALGLAVAYSALGLLRRFGPAALPRLNEIALDWQSVALAVGIVVVDRLRARRDTRPQGRGARVVAGLNGGARGTSGGRRQHRAQDALVVAQVALALVLLVSSGLMIRTFQALLVVDPGFANAGELQTMRLAIPEALEPDAARVVRMQNDIVDALEAIPGVSSAAFLTAMPLEGRDAGLGRDRRSRCREFLEGRRGSDPPVPLHVSRDDADGRHAARRRSGHRMDRRLRGSARSDGFRKSSARALGFPRSGARQADCAAGGSRRGPDLARGRRRRAGRARQRPERVRADDRLLAGVHARLLRRRGRRLYAVP